MGKENHLREVFDIKIPTIQLPLIFETISNVESILSLKNPENIQNTFKVFKINYENGKFNPDYFTDFIESSIQFVQSELSKVFADINNALSNNLDVNLKINAF
ncbi:MAG: hypothetical protein P1U46_03165 [Patescibacteria group bacterium]|nr:hypothetical protein [Patescibacteria group bacterium]